MVKYTSHLLWTVYLSFTSGCMVGLDGFYTILDIVERTEWRLWLSIPLIYCGLSLYLLHLVVWLGWMVFIHPGYCGEDRV
jgi:hypothetical protein